MSNRGRKPKERTGVGAKIHEIRRQLGLSIEQAAGRWGINWSRLSRYETGKAAVPTDVICRIADREDVSADWILGRTDERRVSR